MGISVGLATEVQRSKNTMLLKAAEKCKTDRVQVGVFSLVHFPLLSSMCLARRIIPEFMYLS
jgi:hypothetical protein